MQTIIRAFKWILISVGGAISLGALNELGKDIYSFIKIYDKDTISVIYASAKRDGTLSVSILAFFFFSIIFIMIFVYSVFIPKEIKGINRLLYSGLAIDPAVILAGPIAFCICFPIIYLFDWYLDYMMILKIFLPFIFIVLFKIIRMALVDAEKLYFMYIDVYFKTNYSKERPRVTPWSWD